MGYNLIPFYPNLYPPQDFQFLPETEPGDERIHP